MKIKGLLKIVKVQINIQEKTITTQADKSTC